MPRRVIRDSVLHSERYNSVGIEAKLLFFELLLCADDYGLVPLRPLYLRMHTTACAGKDDGWICKVVSDLMDADLVRPYDADGGRFGFIPRFKNWPRALRPLHPVPPSGCGREEVEQLIKERASRSKSKEKQQ